MPPEFAQQMQQLFARQMVVAFLHHCARLDAPVSLVNSRLAALEAAADSPEGNPSTMDPGTADGSGRATADARALAAEFILEP